VSAAVKRLVDVLASAGGLLVLSPVLLAVAVAVRWSMGSPVLFRQVRPGRHAVPFAMYKFRTMRDAHDENGNPLPDGERLTSVGRFLRKTSLDELPELINVLRGDMSLVGPRPLLMRYLPYYTPREQRRHDVRPGITGWAQVNGRNTARWAERLEMDVWYVEHQSLWLDLKVLARTAASLLGQKGVVVDPRSAMLNLDEERWPGGEPR
jgi:lipopolysaccharide/colanic/teichoic acid biosynthesis glycosyltransferase